MFRLKFNLFSSAINLTLKNSLLFFLITIYELIPVILISVEWIGNDTNYLNTFLKFISSHYHIELINTVLASGTPTLNWDIVGDTTTAASNNHIMSSSFSFITANKFVYFSNLSLDMNNSKFAGILAYIMIALSILPAILLFSISFANIFRAKMNRIVYMLITLTVNFCYFVKRIFAQMVYIVLINYIILYLRFNNLNTNAVSSSDFLLFYISIIGMIVFTLTLLFMANQFRFYSHDYYYDPKSATFDYVLVFLKIMVAVEINLRKFFMTDRIIFSMIIFKILVVALFLYEYFYNEYVANFGFNCFRLAVIIFCSCLSISKIINQFFEFHSEYTMVAEYIFFFFLSIYLIYNEKQRYSSLDFVSNTGEFLKNGSIESFFRNSLRFVIQYKQDRQNLKNKLNAESLENNVAKENLTALNSHFWNCKMKFNDGKRCPLCRIHKKLIVDKATKASDMSSSLVNDHLIILSIFKFITVLETKVYNLPRPLETDLEIQIDNKTYSGFDFIQNFNISDFFFLKYSLLNILDTNLNRMTLTCTIYSNKFKNDERIQTYSRYLKLTMKQVNSDVFKDYKILKIEESLTKEYNYLLRLYQSFLDDVSIKKVNYSELLGRYLNFGIRNDQIKLNLEKLSKTVVMDNRLNFILLISVYKYIFNNTYDRYLSQNYDIEENIKMFESRYVKDNLLVMDFNLHTKKIKINKVPTKAAFKSIFATNDIDRDIDEFFPNSIRLQESKKLVEVCIKNKTNTATIDTYFMDKDYFIHRVILKIKIYLTIESNFKLFATVDFERAKNCVILDKNGKFSSMSRDFYNNFYIHPKVVLKYPTMSLYQFFTDLVSGNEGYDLTNKKTMTVGINLKSYKRNYYRTMKPFENLSTELLYGKIGNEQDFNNADAEDLQNIDYDDKVNNYLIYFKQIEKIKIEADPGLMVAYTFKMRQEKEKVTKAIDEMDKLDESTTSGNDDEEVIDEENVSLNLENEASVAHSVDSGSGGASSNLNQKNDETTLRVFNRDAKKFNAYKKNSKDMTRFCYYTVIINIFILIMGVVFLVVVQSNLTFVTNVFVAFQNFMLQSWDIYMNILGISSFITIKDSKGHFSLNDFVATKLNSSINKNMTLDLTQLLQKDLIIRQRVLNNQIQATNPLILSTLDSTFVSTNVNILTEFFSISFVDNKEQVVKLDLWNEINTLQSVLYNLAAQVKYIGIDIVNMANNSTYLPDIIKYLNTNSTNSEYEKNIFLLINNYYKNIQTVIQQVIINFENYQYQLVSTVNNILIFGFIILLVMDILIIYFTAMLLTIYKQQVRLIMTLIYSIDQDFITELSIKIKYINEFLNNLNNPLKSTDNLKKLAVRSRDSLNKKFVEKMNVGMLSDEEELLKKKEEADKIKFIKDEDEILQKYYSILLVLVLFMAAYFAYGFSVFNSKIQRMYVRLNLTKYFFEYLTFCPENYLELKYSIFLNKTNIDGEYFKQVISVDSYLEKFTTVDEDINYVKKYYMQNLDTLSYFTTLFDSFSKDSTCSFISSINDRFYDESILGVSKSDYDASFIYICNTFDIFHTDFFTVIESLKMQIREMYYDYVVSSKDIDTIKGILDSKKMNDLNLQINYILNPLCDYIVNDVLSPSFKSDITIIMNNCIIILIINIIMSIFFLFITQKYILKKTIESVDNLNTLIKILN